MILGVLPVIGSVIPFIGNVIGAGVGLVSFLLTIIIGSVTIAVATAGYLLLMKNSKK